MIVTDPRQHDNPIVFANDAFLKLTGYTRFEVTRPQLPLPAGTGDRVGGDRPHPRRDPAARSTCGSTCSTTVRTARPSTMPCMSGRCGMRTARSSTSSPRSSTSASSMRSLPRSSGLRASSRKPGHEARRALEPDAARSGLRQEADRLAARLAEPEQHRAETEPDQRGRRQGERQAEEVPEPGRRPLDAALQGAGLVLEQGDDQVARAASPAGRYWRSSGRRRRPARRSRRPSAGSRGRGPGSGTSRGLLSLCGRRRAPEGTCHGSMSPGRPVQAPRPAAVAGPSAAVPQDRPGGGGPLCRERSGLDTRARHPAS